MTNQYKILIADEDEDYRNGIINYLQKDGHYLTCSTKNGTETLLELQRFSPDIIIIDLMLSEIDGFEILEKIKSQDIKPKILIYSALTNNAFIQKAINLGADYYLIKPTSMQTIENRIIDMLNSANDNTNSKRTIDEKITNIFITVGIPAHIKGYYFLRDAVKMAIENPSIINSITKKLYPSIAQIHDTTASKVERAIRHAIEVAWNRGKIEKINSIFGIDIYSDKEKPTNGEFIALVADKMLLDA